MIVLVGGQLVALAELETCWICGPMLHDDGRCINCHNILMTWLALEDKRTASLDKEPPDQ